MLLLIVFLSCFLATGRLSSTNLVPETIRSKIFVEAASTAPKQNFSEAIALQFFIDKDYTMTVQGVIELKNISGKDISLTRYDMDLPYFTLKDTKIGSISPRAFLVDMYSESNSILFAFKSQYTKPVVIGKNGKITFTFFARVDKPYNDYGGLRTLNFPFSLASENRSTSITVHLDESNKILYAPTSPETLTSKRIYSLSPTSGKAFIFSISDLPLTFAISGTSEIQFPLYLPESCETVQPQSCSGCGRISWYPESGEAIAHKSSTSNAVAATFTKDITRSCKPKNTTLLAGFLVLPEKKQLLPASWKVTAGGTYSDYYADGITYAYAESHGYLAIPVTQCKDDTDCRNTVQKLRTYNLSLTNDQTTNHGLVITDASKESLSVRNYRKNKDFFIELTNTSDKFVLLKNIKLTPTNYYDLIEKPSLIIPPKQFYAIQLLSLKTVQTSNQSYNLNLSINSDLNYPVTVNQITVTILIIIEFLAYIFIIALSVTVLTSLAIFLYNKRYGKVSQ